MDLHENPEANSVTATFELPGFNKDDVQIDVCGGGLAVAVGNKISTEHKQSGYAMCERWYGKFSRTLQLPQAVTVR